MRVFPPLTLIFPPPRIEESIGLNCPAAIAWRTLLRPGGTTGEGRWLTFLKSVHWNTDQRGGTWTLGLPLSGNITYLVTLEAAGWPARLILQQESPARFIHHSRLIYTIEPEGKLCRALLEADYVLKPFLIRRIGTAILTDYHSRCLARLKEAAESPERPSLP